MAKACHVLRLSRSALFLSVLCLVPAPADKTPESKPGAGSHEDKDKVEVQCPVQKDRHGTWEGSTSPGGTYVLTCDQGWTVDKNRSWTVKCLDDGEWSAANLTCTEETMCDKRKHGCGPAGTCKEMGGYSDCICAKGAGQ